MVPVAMRKHDRTNVCKSDFEAFAITANRVCLGACVEQEDVACVAQAGGNDQR